MEQYEEDIEHWWFKRYAKGQDKEFYDYMCVALTKGKLNIYSLFWLYYIMLNYGYEMEKRKLLGGN